jgi:hypothetical protein
MINTRLQDQLMEAHQGLANVRDLAGDMPALVKRSVTRPYTGTEMGGGKQSSTGITIQANARKLMPTRANTRTYVHTKSY